MFLLFNWSTYWLIPTRNKFVLSNCLCIQSVRALVFCALILSSKIWKPPQNLLVSSVLYDLPLVCYATFCWLIPRKSNLHNLIVDVAIILASSIVRPYCNWMSNLSQLWKMSNNEWSLGKHKSSLGVKDPAFQWSTMVRHKSLQHLLDYGQEFYFYGWGRWLNNPLSPSYRAVVRNLNLSPCPFRIPQGHSFWADLHNCTAVYCSLFIIMYIQKLTIHVTLTLKLPLRNHRNCAYLFLAC